MLSRSQPPRIARLLETQFALADALHSMAPHTTRAAVIPAPPKGMRWLITPREALEVTPAGDASMMRQAFARYLFWRLFLGQRRPTKESLRECARRLRGLALYRAALKVHAAGRPLPLKASVSARDIPAYALTPPEQLHHLATRAAGDKKLSQQMSQAELDMLLAARWWDSFGDDAEMVASDLFDVERLLTDEDYAVAGDGLMLSDLFGMLADEGLSDFDIAGLLDGAWNGQAVLWAGNQVFDEAGIAASFEMSDPWFYDFLRNQSGYLISNIDRWSRRDIADDLWQWMGGEGGPGYSWEKIARLLEGEYGPYELSALQGYAADYRAYMIALTETARAEGFGMFVSLWESGAKRKIWIVQAGACQICLGNAEAGDIPITQSFPSGVQSPPGHPLCFPAGTVVSGAGVVGTSQRWYDGNLIELTTAGGHTLSCTPNHPVLTTKGWVAAGLLHKGDYVISGTLRKPSMPLVHPDDYQVPARIEQVVDAFGRTFGVTTTRMPGSAIDFHGDGINGKISVVRTNSLLRDRFNATLHQPHLQELLGGRDVISPRFVGASSLQFLLNAVNTSTRSSVGSFSLLPSLFGRESLKDKSIGLSHGAALDTSIYQSSPDRAAVYPIRLREPLLRFASQITGGNLVHGERNTSKQCGTSLRVSDDVRLLTGSEQSTLFQSAGESEFVRMESLCARLDTFTSQVQLDRVLNITVRRFSGHVYNLQTTTGWYIARGIPTGGNGSGKTTPKSTGIIVHNCRCGMGAAISEMFNPNDWSPRNPQDLAPYLSNWTGGLWPNVDLSDMDELAGVGPDDWQQADLFPRSQRARAAKTRQPRPATPSTPLAAHLSTERYKTLATLAGQVAQQWAATAHVRVPTSEDELKRIMRRLRSRDELPDAREADEQYIHTMREGLREVLTPAS